MENCLVCEYRQTFKDGPNYPVHYASYWGVSMGFNMCKIPVCREHVDWVTDEFPETLEAILDLW